MNAAEFVRKWAISRGGERAVSQQHFLDICELLGEKKPAEADPSGDFYTFEKGARTPDGNGFADVWLKDHFAWEYKGKRKDLGAAYKQVSDYREALGNPPLLIVCDIDRFEVHTNWTNTEKWIYSFTNEDILSDNRVSVRTASGPAEDAPRLTPTQVLRALFENADGLKPTKTTDQITRKAAGLFGDITGWLRRFKTPDMAIARFITRLVFCMFATDVGLLPRETFSDVVKYHADRATGRVKAAGEEADAEGFRRHLSELFAVMNTGGEFHMRPVPHFNGRLFTDSDVPEHLTTQQIITLAELDALNWADVEPSIFGTLFERILDPSMRRSLGAHYTSRADIELIVDPVLMAPLRREWETLKEQVGKYLYDAEIRGAVQRAQLARVRSDLNGFIDRLASVCVLDPACGSGNFLYVALALLKALEKEVIAFGAIHDITDLAPRVHPRQLQGIERSPYAVELASIVIWIGYLQWKHRNAMPFDDEEPILEPLDSIHLMDAILDRSPLPGDSRRGERRLAAGAGSPTPREPDWPEADIIVGNPPFLGGKLLRRNLGSDYVDDLFAVWDGRVAREADLCCYWFEKARSEIEAGRVKRVGLLATQGIRGGANRRVLQRIKQSGDIFYAQADRKWIQNGVAVRVSMVGFDDGSETRRFLNDIPDDNPEGALGRALPVEGINANLSALTDTPQAKRLKENLGISFMGVTKVGPFDMPGAVARRMLASPNPDGRSNSAVIKRWVHGRDINSRPRDSWIIDFPPGTTEQDAALYESPFEYVKEIVKPMRAKATSVDRAYPWWVHGRPRPEMRDALAGLSRYLATSMVSKHRIFVWLPPDTLAENVVIVFARDDDYFFGVLQSTLHRVWASAMGTQLRESSSGRRYTPTTTFETFPFPQPTETQKREIAEAAAELNRLREGWLNPDMSTGMLSEKDLKARTLTNLYNQRPTWLVNAHRALDAAVFAAYGWPESPEELSDAEILARLLKLNLEREPA